MKFKVCEFCRLWFTKVHQKTEVSSYKMDGVHSKDIFDIHYLLLPDEEEQHFF